MARNNICIDDLPASLLRDLTYIHTTSVTRIFHNEAGAAVAEVYLHVHNQPLWRNRKLGLQRTVGQDPAVSLGCAESTPRLLTTFLNRQRFHVANEEMFMESER